MDSDFNTQMQALYQLSAGFACLALIGIAGFFMCVFAADYKISHGIKGLGAEIDRYEATRKPNAR